MSGAGVPGRRPLASRDAGWAQALARRLAATSVTPNAISMASVGCAAIACLAFAGVAHADGAGRAALLVVAALGCQGRLLCNLLDGMVAIEGGKRTADGALWNELPDRFADLLVFVGLGLACGVPALGWAAGAFAVLTAYVRELGRAIDGVSDFSGPLAKPQRMALVTVASVVSAFEGLWDGRGGLLRIALWALVLGTLATALRRGGILLARLRRR